MFYFEFLTQNIIDSFEIASETLLIVREWAKLTIDNGIYVAP